MAKREFSSTLKNLKFMQRAAKKEEEPKQEEATLKQENSFGSSVGLSRKCIVIMEGNPHPGAVKGRMSFQNFNPSVDKMNQEVANTHNKQACNSINENQNVTTSYKMMGIRQSLQTQKAPRITRSLTLKGSSPRLRPRLHIHKVLKEILVEMVMDVHLLSITGKVPINSRSEKSSIGMF